jgi:hypothetical protein
MHRVLLCLTLLALQPQFAHAFGPADYVYVPNVTYGEREIDLKAGGWKKRDEERLNAWSIGYGYGITQRWGTELYIKYESSGSERVSKFDAWEWENKFQVTEQGEYPVDAGLILEIERPKNRAEGYEIKLGPLFQTDFGDWQLNGNFLFQRSIRAATPQQTEFGYQWQVKYRWRPAFTGIPPANARTAWDPRYLENFRLAAARRFATTQPGSLARHPARRGTHFERRSSTSSD